MTTKPHQRASCPTDRGTPAIPSPAAAGARPDHAAHHGRTPPRKTPDAVSMDYQQGFFSGPSS